MATATKLNRTVFRTDRAKVVMSIAPAQAVRLTGVLAAGVSLLEDTLTFERVDVKDWQTLSVSVDIAAGGQGACAIDLYPMASNATQDDTTGVRVTGAAPTTVTAADVSNATNEYITMDVSAFEYVDIELDTTATASDQTDLNWVDVFFG